MGWPAAAIRVATVEVLVAIADAAIASGAVESPLEADVAGLVAGVALTIAVAMGVGVVAVVVAAA